MFKFDQEFFQGLYQSGDSSTDFLGLRPHLEVSMIGVNDDIVGGPG